MEEAAASPEGWRRLRPVTKEDFIEDQALSPPYGTRLCLPFADLGLIVESSGSSGRGRETHYLSRGDVDRLAQLWARHLARMGIGELDVVALTFPIGMAGGGVKHAAAYAALGAKLIRISNLSAAQKLEAMRYYRATVLVATPSYVDRLAVAALEAKLDPRDLGLRRIVVATQSVSVDWVRQAQERWEARLYEWYGTSAGLVAFCCEQGMVVGPGRRGTLHWDADSALQEVVDPETGRWASDGERGELVGTALINEAEPYFRYATGDEARFVAPGSCPCGSDRPGIESGTVRRLDQMFKVKGVNIWPSHIEASLFAFPAVQDYRAKLLHDAAHREVAHVEVLAPRGEPGLAEELAGLLREQTGIGFSVSLSRDPEGWSQETGGEAAKTRRWLDERTR